MMVVGAGPAGLAAAVYGASEGLRTLVIEPMDGPAEAVTPAKPGCAKALAVDSENPALG